MESTSWVASSHPHQKRSAPTWDPDPATAQEPRLIKIMLCPGLSRAWLLLQMTSSVIMNVWTWILFHCTVYICKHAVDTDLLIPSLCPMDHACTIAALGLLLALHFTSLLKPLLPQTRWPVADRVLLAGEAESCFAGNVNCAELFKNERNRTGRT